MNDSSLKASANADMESHFLVVVKSGGMLISLSCVLDSVCDLKCFIIQKMGNQFLVLCLLMSLACYSCDEVYTHNWLIVLLDHSVLNIAACAVTWLILPVVICLSQRLSHACLSINTLYTVLNCGWLIKTVIVYLMVPYYYLDTRSNSRANTCAKIRPFGEGLCLFRYKTNAWLSGHGIVGDSRQLFESHGIFPAIGHSNFCPISFGW